MRKRLLVIGPTPPPYHGVATFIRDLLKAPHPRIELLHLDTSDRRDAANIGRWDAGNIQLGFSNLAELAGRVRRARIDAVYVPISQNVPAFLRDALFIFQARAAGCRVIVHLHGGYFRALYDNSSPAFRAVARGALNAASSVIVLGDEFRSIFSGLVPEDKIAVVANGVPDPDAWPLRLPWSPAPRRPCLLYMSTLTRTKGILELFAALPILRRQFPDVILKVAGHWSDADFQHEAEAFIAREKLQDSVHFAGNVDGTAKAEFLASGDLFCLPTRYEYEGQPLVLLEAMASGLPIVSTRHAAIGSTVLDGITGLLVPKDCQPASLAAALALILADAPHRNAMSHAARQRYLSHFTQDICHSRLLKIVESVCGCDSVSDFSKIQNPKSKI